MLRELAKRAVVRASGTPLGRRAVTAAVRTRPELAVEPLSEVLNRPARFDSSARWPESLDGFEDLSFLFSSNPANWGIAALTFDEAAYLYRLARSLPDDATIAEIGRFKGGSTFVIAAAMGPRARLYSYDLHVKLTDTYDGADLDAALRNALDRYGLAARVEIVVADSRSAEPPQPCTLVFIDGDHSYEGVRADYENWRRFVAPGGHLVFHDAVPAGGVNAHHEEVAQLVAEVERDDADLERRAAQAGSLAHFVRRPDV